MPINVEKEEIFMEDQAEGIKSKISMILISLVLILIIVCVGMIGYKNMPRAKYNNPIVPEGFKKVETKEASWQEENGIIKGWNNGLVIEDEIGNQFVWVPVDNYKVKYEKNDRDEYIVNSGNSILKIGDDIQEDEYIQIKKFGGFYIARYEAGLPEELQDKREGFGESTNNKVGIPVSKAGMIPWNYISYTNAKKSAQNMYVDNKSVDSDIITGTQWDTVCEWMYKTTGSSIYFDLDPSGYNTSIEQKTYSLGNYKISKFTYSGLVSKDDGKTYSYVSDAEKQKDENILLATGVNQLRIGDGKHPLPESNMTNNVFDLAGNLEELTTEYIELNQQPQTSVRTSRGGNYSVLSNYAKMSHRSTGIEGDINSSKTGFRVVLYLK